MVRHAELALSTWLALMLAVLGAPALASPSPAAPRVGLPDEVPSQHLGVATCASSVCHGAATPSAAGVRLDEYVTWSHRDAHAKAYVTLQSARSRQIAARLGSGDPTREPVCLECHADNVPAERRGERFRLSDGIGCEACHGGAEHWLTTHASKHARYADNVARGMYPSADLPARAALCLACHDGSGQRFATHRLMAAGHPRLSFELDTFLALEPPHWRMDAAYARRKPSYGATQIWAYGQVAAGLLEVQRLSGPRFATSTLFPELALFNCYGCHFSSMRRYDGNRKLMTVELSAGGVPLEDSHLRLAYLIARVLDPAHAPALLARSQALLAATRGVPQGVVAAAHELEPALERLRSLAAAHAWTQPQRRSMLDMLLALGLAGEFRDYIGAEQAVMAIDGLLIESGLAERYRKTRDELYRLVEHDEAFSPEAFGAGLRALQAALQTQSGP